MTDRVFGSNKLVFEIILVGCNTILIHAFHETKRQLCFGFALFDNQIIDENLYLFQVK